MSKSDNPSKVIWTVPFRPGVRAPAYLVAVFSLVDPLPSHNLSILFVECVGRGKEMSVEGHRGKGTRLGLR